MSETKKEVFEELLIAFGTSETSFCGKQEIAEKNVYWRERYEKAERFDSEFYDISAFCYDKRKPLLSNNGR